MEIDMFNENFKIRHLIGGVCVVILGLVAGMSSLYVLHAYMHY